MKKVFHYYDDDDKYIGCIVVGTTAEIEQFFQRVWNGDCPRLMPYYSDYPRFSKDRKMYAIDINEDGYVTVINSDTALSILMDDGQI